MNDEGADRGQEGIPAEPSVARRPAGPDRFSRAMLTVAALSLVALLAEVGYQTTTGFAMPFFLRGHLHLEMRVISLMTMCFLIAETGAKIPFGSLSDRYGRRRFVIMGPLISALAALAITTVPHPAMIAVLRAIDGIGAAMLWPTLFASVADVVDERRRATAMSLFNLMYIGGVVLGPLLYETVFRATQSDVMVFYVLAGFFVVAALLAWGVAPRPAAATVAEAVRPAEGHEAPTLSAWGIVWGQPILRAMLMVAVIQFVGLHMLNGVLSIYLNEDLGISKEMMGRVFLYVGIVVAVLAVPMGRLVDQMGKPEAIRLGLAVCAVGMWILPWVRSMPLLVMAALPLAPR